jgi:chorismate mutase
MADNPDAPPVTEALHRYLDEVPTLPTAPSEADLRPWRDRIDAIDRKLLALLNERLAYADVIGYLKDQMDVRAYAPKREAEIMENVIARNEGPFPDSAIRRVFEKIIEETRSLEERKYEGDA